MTMTAILAIGLGAVWGVVWALCLQTPPGRFLVARYTWLTVVIGVGIDLSIGLLVVPIEAWLPLVIIFGASSIGIIGRSIANDMSDAQMMRRIRAERANEHTDETSV